VTAPLPRVTSARDLFVFAGAGASYAPPAALALFDPMRNAILDELNLHEYVPGSAASRPDLAGITRGLAPEPFMFALRESGVDVEGWLTRTLRTDDPYRPEPNAVHVALAQLAASGAAVWTVNFDTLIEEAVPGLRTVSWPADPARGGDVFKPHGSLPGPLILASDDVLRGLRPDWERALTEAVRRPVVVFIGYSGRDFDFQPLWDELLDGAGTVIWFYRPDPDDPEEPARRRRLLRRCVERDALIQVESANPSVDFVAWCERNGMASVAPSLVDRLSENRPERPFPRLDVSSGEAEATIRGVLGDWRGAIRTNLSRLRHEPGRRAVATQLAKLVVNNAGRWVTVPLWWGGKIPFLPPQTRIGAERKRLTVHSRLGNHRPVLRGTRHVGDQDLSTLLILRAEALRVTGSLDEAVDAAAEAYDRARTEAEPVRVAHAAFQQAQALLWAERLDECRRCLDQRLRPASVIAAARWVAWADFVEGGIAVHEGDPIAAEKYYELSEQRFRGEGLTDGVVSVQTARLTVQRMQTSAGFPAALAELRTSMASTDAQSTFFTKGHPFTDEAVLIEEAEYARTHRGDLDSAGRAYATVARSRFPLQRSLGLLGVGSISVERGADRVALSEARDLATRIGARLIARHADAALALPGGRRPGEVYFC
jgi:hypothetical protein